MRRSCIAVAVIAVVGALAPVSTASADAPHTTGTTTPLQVIPSSTVTLPAGGPKPNVLCGPSCGEGGANWYCATVSGGSTDSYGNNITVYYHWCYDYLGHVQQGYGYSTKTPCNFYGVSPCSLAYVDYDIDFNYGHRTQAHFNDNLHVLSSVTVAVCVDGYGNSWYC